MAQRKLVIISIDSMGYKDLADLSNLAPNLTKLRDQGSWVKRIEGVSPTLTYPSHTTIVTGQYPAVHGIINNTKLQPKRESSDWLWYHRYIKVLTLYDLAHQKGLTTAALLWPVTGSSKIDYNLAEIFSNRPWSNQVLVSLKSSSPKFIYEMNKKYGHMLHGIKQPWRDDFITACAVDTLENKKPDLMLLHLVDLDSMRHRYGVNSAEAKAAWQRQDKRIGQIINATKKAGTFADTNFVIVGDHYQIDVNKMIHLNMIFEKEGWLESIPGKPTYKNNWTVTAKNCDGEAYIYTCGKVDLKKVKESFAQVEGIEAIYDQKEAIAKGADPNCSFLVAAKPGYYFTDEVNRPAIVEEVDPTTLDEPNRYKGMHGFDPNEPNYFTSAIFFGPDINSGVTVEKSKMVNEAPTLARLLNVKFPEPIAGKEIREVLKKIKRMDNRE